MYIFAFRTICCIQCNATHAMCQCWWAAADSLAAVWWAAGARTDAGEIRRSRCTYAGAVGSAATKFTRVVAPIHAVPLEKLCLQIDPWHWPSVSFASRQLCLDSGSSSVSGCRNTGANVPNLVRNLASQSNTSRIVVFLREKSKLHS